MPKFEINNDIGLSLKELRLKHNIKAKEIADLLLKSPAYVTKIEKGDIKHIDSEDLKAIVNFITKDENGYESFMHYLAENSLINTKTLFFINFDNIECKIPVNKSLIDYINDKMDELNILPNELIDYVNKNEDLNDDFFTKRNMIKENITTNIWHTYYTDSDTDPINCYILLNLTANDFELLLNREIDRCSYTFMNAIIYHLLKWEKKLKNEKIMQDELTVATKNILNEFKFYTMLDRVKFVRKAKTEEEYYSLLNEFDIENRELINKLLKRLDFISQYDVKYTNEKLSSIVTNLNTQLTFALGFMALNLEPLSKIHSNTKKEFLKEVANLIEIYKDKQEPEITLEKF